MPVCCRRRAGRGDGQVRGPGAPPGEAVLAGVTVAEAVRAWGLGAPPNGTVQETVRASPCAAWTRSAVAEAPRVTTRNTEAVNAPAVDAVRSGVTPRAAARYRNVEPGRLKGRDGSQRRGRPWREGRGPFDADADRLGVISRAAVR